MSFESVQYASSFVVMRNLCGMFVALKMSYVKKFAMQQLPKLKLP